MKQLITREELVRSLTAIHDYIQGYGEKYMDFNGMCGVAQWTNPHSILKQEYLTEYIVKHRPKRGVFYDKGWKATPFFWERGLCQPRIDWLNHRIKIEQSKIKTPKQ